MRRLVCFDISNGRKRRSIVRLCLYYGFRVQKSVFETFMDGEDIVTFESAVEKIIDADHDSVRIYPLDAQASEGISIIGAGKRIEQKKFEIL